MHAIKNKKFSQYYVGKNKIFPLLTYMYIYIYLTKRGTLFTSFLFKLFIVMAFYTRINTIFTSLTPIEQQNNAPFFWKKK